MEQLEVQYLHDYVGINTSVRLTANSIVNFSGVIGTNILALRADLSKAIGVIRHAANKFAICRIRECC